MALLFFYTLPTPPSLSTSQNLVNPQRCLVLKACVSELDCTHSHKRKSHKRTLLIFNDLVVAAKKNKDQYVYKASFPLFNTAATQFNVDGKNCTCLCAFTNLHVVILHVSDFFKAAQNSIQIYSLLDKKVGMGMPVDCCALMPCKDFAPVCKWNRREPSSPVADTARYNQYGNFCYWHGLGACRIAGKIVAMSLYL